MKTPTFVKSALIAVCILMGISALAQNYQPFSPRFEQTLRGDILLIGNTIVERASSGNPGGNSNFNSNSNMVYIDIDSDPTTFSSSSADLVRPDESTCFNVVYAGLYWSAIYQGSDRSGINQIKFKEPGATSYTDITGEILYDAGSTPIGDDGAKPYACYYDVTDIVTVLPTTEGTYTVANVTSSEGLLGDTGLASGWSIFIVFEDPNYPGKYIASSDGFSAIDDSTTLNIPYSGFSTIPAGPVRAKYAFSALEGDGPENGDFLKLNGSKLSTPTGRNQNNYFNSSFTKLNGQFSARNPYDPNTRGLDAGVSDVPNPANNVIDNNETSLTFQPGTTGDEYYFYFHGLAIEIIQPEIPLVKTVEDTAGNIINDANVTLGQELDYVLTFQNIGNDGATNYTITDVLPTNVDFLSVDLSGAPGVTYTYDPIAHSLVFTIPDSLIEEGDPEYSIRIKVKVVDECNELRDACSNLIENLAYSTYYSYNSGNVVAEQDPSGSAIDGCGDIIPGSTNFLVGIDGCDYIREEVLCGGSVTLTAGDGYLAYQWYQGDPATGTPIGNNQSVTVTSTGTYTVVNTAPDPCLSITETVNVVLFGADMDNPVTPYANQVVVCPNDGTELPEIFLCGADDTQLIETNITDATSITWDVLNEGSCTTEAPTDCPNTSPTCSWTEVGTGPTYNVTAAGQYQLTITYQNGCFKRFYFNVYQNIFTPDETHSDIICDTDGQIIVTGVPAGYEYSIVSASGPYQTSNIFTITTPGDYTVFIRPIGVPINPCIFTIPNIPIRQRDFSVDLITNQPLCHDDFGDITVHVNDVNPQYYYELIQNGAVINDVGPIDDNAYTFSNLNAGDYTLNINTDDGCIFSGDTNIIVPEELTADVVLTQPLTCEDGAFNILAEGGTPPYVYFINSTTEFQSASNYTVSTPGTYDITVIDYNNCSATTQIVVDQVQDPEYTVNHTDIQCNGNDDGTITINTTNSNGYTMAYSIDNGTTFSAANTFTNLAPGTYNIVINYTLSGVTCSTTETVVINDVPLLQAAASVTQEYTCLTSGTIEGINVSGGTPPYQYSIDGVNFQASGTFTNLTNGDYTITVMDANGCTVTTNTITLDELNPPTDLTFSSTAVNCPNLTSDVTVTTVGTNTPYTYQITAPVTVNNGTNNTFTGLAPGTYTFLVTDAKDCTYEETYTINDITPISINGQVINNVDCFGASTGNAIFNVSGYTGTYSYTLNGGSAITGQSSSSINVSNVAAGTYTIVVTDETTNCTATTSVTIDQPTAPLADAGTTVSPITCLNDGSVTINTTGGWGNNQYTLTLPDASTEGPQNNSTFAGLSQAGSYTYTIEDFGGCTITGTFNLVTPTAPIATINATSDLCYDGTDAATIVVDVTGGVAPYTYSLNGGAYQTSNTFANLTPGTYSVTVQDAYGCTSVAVSQTIADQLTAAAVLTKNLDCTASPDAEITVTINGGTTAYAYQASYNGGALSASTAISGNSFVYNTANAGTYDFIITDAIGCTVQTATVTVTPLPVLNAPTLAIAQDILCNGDSSGAITVTPSGGLAPYTIEVVNNSTGQNYGSQTSGLNAGDYTVTVTDANSCTETANITINQPDAITYNVSTVDISCNNPGGTQYGEIIVENVTGGTAEYTYYVSNNFGYSDSYTTTAGGEDHSFTILDFGIYQVDVIDANGCSVITNNISIASPPSDLTIDISTTTVDCSTGGTAVITVTAAVLSGNYEFAILETNTLPYSSSYQSADAGTPESSTFTGLVPGVVYTFVVHDLVTDCYYFETASGPIDSPSNITSTLDQVNNVTCTGADDGSVSFSFNGYDATATSVDYEIFNAQANTSTGITGSVSPLSGGSESVTNVGPLAPGMYYILLTEVGGTNDGCSSATVEFTITESTMLLEVSASIIKNDNCNPNAGVISATGQYGTAPYQYQLVAVGDPAPTASTWTGSTSGVFNAEGGDYVVYIMDAYGCIQSTNITLPTDPSPTISIAMDTTTTCNDEGNYSIVVTRDNTVGVAPFTYSIDGSAYATYTEDASFSFTLSNLNSGTHTVIIQDANGCTDTEIIDILTPVQASAAVSIASTPDCGVSDGIITVNASGGSGSFTYTIAPSPASVSLSGNEFSGVPAGSYTITITDATTGCSIDIPAEVPAAEPVVFDASNVDITDVSCNGGNDGTITIVLPATNNDPPYTYTLTGTSPVVAAQTNGNGIFTGLAAGNYDITVTSNRNCTATISITVDEPTAVTASATATDFACAADNTVMTSTITITASGGTPTYYYSIDGLNYFAGNTFDVTDTGSVQNITLYVKDSNNCVTTTTVTINPLPVITDITITQITPISCTGDEEIKIEVIGGSGNFTFQQLPSGTPQSIGNFTLTQPGSYSFLITDTTTGCYSVTVPYDIPPFDIITASATPISGVTCYGDTDGSISVSVSGYSGPYSYSVLDSAGNPLSPAIGGLGDTATNPLVINNMPAGNFTVQITETAAPFCTEQTATITVDSPPTALDLEVNYTEATCTDDQGTITAIASGGAGGYQYQFTDGTGTVLQGYSADNTIDGLGAGTYFAMVTDANLCEVSSSIITLTTPTPISASISASPSVLDCFNDNNATITVSGTTGGQGSGYLYTLVNVDSGETSGPQPGTSFGNLSAGTYHVIITDGWNCTFTTTDVTITEPADAVTATLSMVSTPTCTNDAELHIEAIGGTAPYTYSTDGTTFLPLLASNSFIVGPGTYQYYVQDANGCTVVMTNEVVVEPVLPVTIDLDLSGAFVSCAGGSNATIIADASNGLGNYSYELVDLDSSSVIQGPQTTGIFGNLPAGNYQVNVTSGPDCTASSSIISIIDPNPLVVSHTKTDITCNGLQDGTITINASGGTGVSQYAISPNLNQFYDDNIFTDLAAGIYDIVVQDQNGCYEMLQVEIIEPDPVAATLGAINDEVCLNEGDGSITVDITGGSGTYDVTLMANGVTTSTVTITANQYTFTGLSGNIFYQIAVTDSNGCYISPALEYFMAAPVEVIPAASVDVTCTNNTPGNVITITVNPEVDGQVQYSLDDITYSASNVFTDLPPGNYTAYAQHTNGCTKTVDFVIEDLQPITASATVVADVLCTGDNTGAIEVTASGGTGVLQYAISPSFTYGTSNTFNNLSAGNYTIMVTDEIGCEIALTNIIVSEPVSALSASLSGVGETCLAANDGEVTVTISGGTPPYYTSIDGINFTQDQFIYAGLVGGQTYTFYVQDDNGCQITPLTFDVPVGVDILPSVDVIDNCTNNVPGNVVVVNANPALLPDLQYSIDGVTYGASNIFTDLAPNTYTAYVQHTNGCIQTADFTINALQPVSASASVTQDVLCHGEATG
ncbi:hypothetical protein, partial [Mangrovimonas aestuarii]|uniref:hypothetical protein n=1 Tax=Mangrovimonas aestuarii TaxID=3018443 RepID=UPI002378193A